MEIEKEKQNSALIIIDIQNNFKSDQSFEVYNASKIIPQINSLRNKFQTIFFIKDCNQKQHIFFVEARQVSDIIIQKGIDTEYNQYSGFGNEHETTKLGELLKEKGITNLFIVGLFLDNCVRNTAIDGITQGYKVFIVKEGTLASTEIGEQETLKLLKKHNISYISIDEVNKHL